jgi:hypothetical protein
MTRGECLHQADGMCVHSTQDRDVEDLVRAALDVELTRRKALRDSKLWV